MSVVNEYKDPMSGKVNHFAKGSIKFVNIKPVRGADADGVKRTHIAARNGQPAKVIEATHSISFLLQEVDADNNVIDPQSAGEWVGMGDKKLHSSHTEKVQVKFDSGYKDILPGMVVSFPLKVSKNGEKVYINGTLSGKVFNILDESKAGQSTPRQNGSGSSQQPPAASGTSGGKTSKVFGEIISQEGSEISVKDEKAGVVKVILNDEQLALIQVGGRLAGMVNAEGKITTGFKAYGPAGQSSGSTNSSANRSSVKKDNSGIETGHAINGALNLSRVGLAAPIVEIAKVVHDVTRALKQEAANDVVHKSLSDYDLGAMVGHAVLNATRDIQVNEQDTPEVVKEKILGYCRELLAQVVPQVSAYVKGVQPQPQQQETSPEPQLQVKKDSTPAAVTPEGRVDMSPSPDTFDFDDDIPF